MLHRAAFFEIGEAVILDSKVRPEINGPQVICDRMWIQAKGCPGGWVYRLLDQGTAWMLERSLRKDLNPSPKTFDQLLSFVKGD